MSPADLSKSEAYLIFQQVNVLCTNSNTSIIMINSMEEDIPKPPPPKKNAQDRPTKIRDYTPL